MTAIEIDLTPDTADRELVVVVIDVPQPQGSKTKGRFGNIRDANVAKLTPWREAVKTAALRALEGHDGPPLHPAGVAVEVEATFTFPRVGTHYGTGRNAGVLKDSAPAHHVKTPDLDKLLRSCFDSFTAAGVWKDDCQVVAVLARKCYPGGHPDTLEIPGAVIRVRAVTS